MYTPILDLYGMYLNYCEEMSIDLNCGESEIKKALELSQEVVIMWSGGNCCNCLCGCCTIEDIQKSIFIMASNFLKFDNIEEVNPKGYQIESYNYLLNRGCIQA